MNLTIFLFYRKNEKTPETLDFTWFSGGVFGVLEVIRTPDLPLRSAQKRSPLRPFDTPGVPYFTGFLTILSVRISLQNTPVFPG